MTFDRCFGCMQKLKEPDEVCPHCGFDIAQYNEAEFALRPGTILHGRYVIGKVLGKGGFGITYIGYDMSLDIKVAIKEYYPEGFVGRDARQSAKLSWYSTRTGVQSAIKSRESVIKEARNMAKIDTLPTLVRVRDVLVANETAYLVMDYVEGETLKNLVINRGTLSYEEVCTYLFPIMEDLSKIHEKGIIHRDISPDNIMIEANGRMRLLDLGAAKDLYKVNENGEVPASTQMVLKHGFSPMEQYRTHGEIGPWTDVYAMTATIYYLMSGTVLPTPMDRLDKEQEEKVRGMINRLSMPEKAREGMKKGLAILKEDRISSMSDLKKYLCPEKVELKPKLEVIPQIESNSKLILKSEQKYKDKTKLNLKKLKKWSFFLLGAILVGSMTLFGTMLFHKRADKYYSKGKYEQALNAYRQEKNIDGVKKTLKMIYKIAGCYKSGISGYEKNEEEAIKYYKLVAEDENAESLGGYACNFLGEIMAKNEIEEDDTEAATWFEKAIKKGYFDAANNLIYMYKNGKEVPQDNKKIIELLEQSANSGNSTAMYNMGRIYGYGECNQEVDLRKSLNWFKIAEENNFEDAKDDIEYVLQKMYDTAKDYRKGTNGCEKNEEEAIKYYKLVAEDESAEEELQSLSCYYLGYIMANNETEEDDAEAARWYERAIEKGDTDAMNNLADMYKDGRGVSQDYKKAMKLYEQAIEKGNAVAKNDLAYMYMYGEGVDRDYKKAMELYKQAANDGVSTAMANIGWIYEWGLCGQQKDLKKALKWYKKAQENGYDNAEEHIQYLQSELESGSNTSDSESQKSKLVLE
ncbi:SEL1-like repeat protein [Blautia sp. MSJ-9]|nr:SEL1-like repeat protein [Blautia sp. MSJ-9]